MVAGDKKPKGITKPSPSDKGTANKKKGSPLPTRGGGGGSSSGKDKQASNAHTFVSAAGGAAAGPVRGPSADVASLGGQSGIGPQFVVDMTTL